MFLSSEDSVEEPATLTGTALIGVVAVALLLALAYRASSDGFIPVLDHANLVFHEAGHVVFGIFGSTLGLYGGTLGQLVFPVVVTIRFWRKGMLAASSLGLIWFCQNLLNIARYVADARAQELPLVGGGEHDWLNILSRWGALSADTALARGLSTLAWMGIIVTIAWAVVVWNRSRAPQ